MVFVSGLRPSQTIKRKNAFFDLFWAVFWQFSHWAFIRNLQGSYMKAKNSQNATFSRKGPAGCKNEPSPSEQTINSALLAEMYAPIR
jgi:hypothetical protein